MRGFVCRLAIAVVCLTGCAASIPDQEVDGARPVNVNLLGAGNTASGGSGPLSTLAAKKTPLSRAELAGGDVVVTEFEGYCIDPDSVVARVERGFAMFASCNILSGGDIGDHVRPLLATVTVGPRGEAGDLPSPAALARSSSGELLHGETDDNFVAAQMSGAAKNVPDGAGETHWRSAFVVSGRLVGVALYVPEGSPLAGKAGGQMLRRLQDHVTVTTESGAPVPEGTPAERVVPARTGLLDRLFNR